MEVIAKNKEDYFSFSVDVAVDKYVDKEGNEEEKLIEVRFIDSFKFMSDSRIIQSCNTIYLPEKGIYPNEYMSSWDHFEEMQLPPIEAFYSKLSMSSISSNDCQHAQRVWKEFRIHNLGDYHDLYLRTDVVLLANMYEAFRETCLEHYKLDPAHFYTSPGLAWEACLKCTGIKLELLTDPDMLLMLSMGQRWNYSSSS